MGRGFDHFCNVYKIRGRQDFGQVQASTKEIRHIYIIHAAVTLDYYSAGGGGGGCCLGKRENDRKVRSIVDRKPEKKCSFGQCMFHSLILNQTAFPEGTRAHEVPQQHSFRVSQECTCLAGPDS